MKPDDKVFLRYIGGRFKDFRENVGYSRREAADMIGITMRTLASYERGEREPSMDTAIKMAGVYKTTFTRLTDYKNIFNNFRRSDNIISFSDWTEGNRDDGERLQKHTV